MSQSAPDSLDVQAPTIARAATETVERATPEAVAEDLREGLYQFLVPLLALLDRSLDVRLVRTFLAAIETILLFRHRPNGLLLSELGAYLLSPDKAPAGTKRLSNLLRSPRWSGKIIERWLWQRADGRRQEIEETGQEETLLLWDESVLEKPESRKAEDLCPVRSSKAQRLARSRPNPSRVGAPPVFVGGLHWVCLLLLGMSGPPVVAAMRWFSTRGERAQEPRAVQCALLKECARRWGKRVLHVLDRGYAGSPWIAACFHLQIRFLLRWPKRYKLLDAEGNERAAWQILRGQKSWEERFCWDARRKRWRKIGILALLVAHPEEPHHPLWLVGARPGDGVEPWYLLTSEPIQSADDAWRMVLCYARRWQIEMSFRFGKSELAMESPRLWSWERREKLLLMVTLAYAFLFSLLSPDLETLRQWLLRHFCHRTGKRSRDASAPLYRLRAALSRLWLAHPLPKDLPILPTLDQTPG